MQGSVDVIDRDRPADAVPFRVVTGMLQLAFETVGLRVAVTGMCLSDVQGHELDVVTEPVVQVAERRTGATGPSVT